MNIDTSIFKAYDIRGIYPNQINEELAYKLGQAYVAIVKPKNEVLIGYDVRIHSKVLKDQIAKGICDSGINVLDVGWMSTDMLYFGVGTYKTDGGIQVTASHNPPEWHGTKMVKQGVVPMTLESGIAQIRDYISSGKTIKCRNKGTIRRIDSIVDDYSHYILTWIDVKKVKPLTIVYNPNFGFAGKIFQRIVQLGKLPLKIVPLNAEPNGNFPKGRPDPFVPENRPEFINLVKSSKADFGVAWDADADRVFFCADGGIFTESYYTNTILIKSLLKKYPKSKIIYDPRYTWALIDCIKENSGIPVISRVGHSYIKEKMREVDAIFAGESSGHTYYRDYWYSDCGMIPLMQMIEYLSVSKKRFSEHIRPVMNKYIISGEINTEVKDTNVKMQEILNRYSNAKISKLDGVSIEYKNFRFTVRPSNTEPLLRLTLEARSQKLMKEKRDEILNLIRS